MVTVKEALRAIRKEYSDFQDVHVLIVENGIQYFGTTGYFLFNGAWSDLMEKEVENYSVEECHIFCA